MARETGMDSMIDLSIGKKASQYEQMIQIAKLYYMEDMSQQQIADRVNMSRSNVSRILKSCKELGIVEIRIHEASLRSFEIKKKLINRFGIGSVVITPRVDDREASAENAGIAAARYVENVLTDNMSVGIGWGASVYKMVKAFTPTVLNNMQIIQLMGGTRIKEAYKDGVQLTLDFAEKTSGTPYILNAPLLVTTRQVRDLFIEEGGIKDQLEMTKKIDVALVTLGTNEPESNAMVRANFMTPEQSKELYDAGLYSHILGQHIDIRGKIGNTELNDRVVGININTFKKIPLKIGIVVGEQKVKAIVSALMGGFLDTLITDEPTAFAVEDYAAKHGLYKPF
ncbi:sugar-binding transcriptional regulator [Christensenella timonensis]|uniref:sugar-binding transcriptional regulator n=1 Tax=Christensenella timonensis TaxID=1816678 RepID=UPI001390229C|nr:sugar-binding transcriptional regulator [Christensenella timonensis]